MTSSRQWKPHPYQIRACNDLLANVHWALWLDPGLGKTAIVLRALKQIKETVGYRKTLIVGPLRVVTSSWPAELAKWDDFRCLRAEVFHGRDPLEMRESTADIILVNYDYLKKMNDAAKVFDKGSYGTYCHNMVKFFGLNGLVVDELTAFKNTNSLRYKFLSRNLADFQWRWGLTGTPVANRLVDIFGQAFILDMGAQFGKYVTRFQSEYFSKPPYLYRKYDATNNNWQVVSEEKRLELFERIGRLGTRMSARDYLDMPQFVENVVEVDFDGPAREQYRSMQKDLVAVLGDDTVTAVNRAAALNKCRQMASGWLYVEDGSARMVHQAKADALERLVDELNGKPLLTFINFRSEAEELKRRFPGAEIIYGGVSAAETVNIIERWNKGGVPVLLAHPATTAHGLNLQAGGNHVCWFTLPWDAEQYDQGNRRLWRQGQEKGVVVCHKLIAARTVDGYVDKVVAGKVGMQDGLFDYLKGMV